MTLLNIVLVALIQGATEFLPVSSSGHLVLLPLLTGLADHGILVDVSVHLGTLAAVMTYFRVEMRMVADGLVDVIRGHFDRPGSRLALCLVIATVPVMAAGLALRTTGLDTSLRSLEVIGWTMLVFGCLLWWADRVGPRNFALADWSPISAIKLGMWQVLALLPGTSRSGITMTGARLMGFGRREAARISMLMSIPTILASGALVGGELAFSEASFPREALLSAAIAGCLSGLVALFVIAFFMRLVERVGLGPFVLYRCALGLVILGVAYS